MELPNFGFFQYNLLDIFLGGDNVVEIGEAIKNPAYRIPQTVNSGCLDISAHA